MKRNFIITAIIVIALCLVAVAAASTDFVSRGLPTANLNNAAGFDRSNVAWSLGSGTVTGDSFKVGTPGTQYKLDSLTVWNIGHKGMHFAQEFSNVTLYIADSSGAIAAVPATFSHRHVHYADGSDYQAQDGSFRKLYEDTFTGMDVTLNGGATYYFAVGGDSSSYDWFNHASNAALAGNAQDGSDGVYYAWDLGNPSVANACDSNGPVDPASFCNGGWDKSSDINVSIGTSAIVTAQSLAQVDQDNVCADHAVLRADGTVGRFLTLDAGTLASGKYGDTTFTWAPFIQGIGEQCDIPAGYHYAGLVDSSGTNTGAAGTNHPFYVKAS